MPPALLNRLKFKDPDQLEKHGTKKWRGRILGSQSQTVFDATWCFFEVGVGRYAADEPNCGGVGLVCFVENQKCGSGLHAAAVSELAVRFATAHPRFAASPRGERNQGVFVYYPGVCFPLQRAVEDMRLLIETCLDSLESLKVKK
jgi:hypothetical protein